MKGYALYTGCLIYSRLPHLEAVSMKVLHKLGLRAERLEGFTCCPEPTAMRVLSQRAWYALAARNLAVAEEAGLNVLTLCNGCNATLFRVSEDLRRDEGLRGRVNEDLKAVGRRYGGGVEVKSILRAIYEDVGLEALRGAAVRELRGVKVALHHGCHIYDELSRFDDVAEPKSFKAVVSALGCEVVDYASEGLCCAAFIRPVDEELSLTFVREKVEDAVKAGADCMVVICPTCLIQLDVGQVAASRKLKAKLELPVLYLTQLMGLSMGMTLDEVGFKYHSVRGGRLAEGLMKA
jgi:heterodisulfide reductase subunit B